MNLYKGQFPKSQCVLYIEVPCYITSELIKDDLYTKISKVKVQRLKFYCIVIIF